MYFKLVDEMNRNNIENKVLNIMRIQHFRCLLLVCVFAFFADLTSETQEVLAENKQTLTKTTSPQEKTKNVTPVVMLARKWSAGMDVSGWLMSEKLDGVRAYWNGKDLLSRTGKIFSAPSWFTKNFPDTALDGELWLGRQRFSDTLGIVRRKLPHDGWEDVRYMIFEAPQGPGGFEERIGSARRWFLDHPSLYADVIDQKICRDEEHLLQRLKEIEAMNGEGIILRRPGSAYVAGRSHAMLKVKTFSEAEAVVLKHLPGSGKNKGRLGSVQVELPNGKRFAIGSGFSDEDRLDPPPIGCTITFKHYGYTNSGIPRFAVFKAIRKDY